MENKAHALAAGLFLLLLGLGLAAAVAWFEGDRIERVRYTVVAHTGVPGLNLKAPVKLRGVEVGRVESIVFDPADPRQILVSIQVDQAAPVSTEAYAQLGLQGVTGLSFISLEEAPTTGVLRRVPAEARIELRPTLLDRLAERGPGLLTGFAETAERMNQLLSDGNRQELTRTITQLGQSAEAATKLLTALQPSAQRLPGVLQDADTSLTGATATLREIQAFAADGRALTQQLRQRAEVLDRIDAAARQVQATSHNLELALVGETPPRSRPLFGDLSAASRRLERTAGELGEQPQSLIWGRSSAPPGPGEPGFAERTRSGP
jgi:phospholipid/cholesterol/gamma-HCH transport system substrate-binding protein